MSQFRVVVRQGAAEVHNDLWDGVVSLGRGPKNDISLVSHQVSREHAEIRLDDSGELVVRDCGSKNGIKIGDRRIHGGELALGREGTIRLGPYVVEICRDDEDETETEVALDDDTVLHRAPRLTVDANRLLVLLDGRVLFESLPRNEMILLGLLAAAAPKVVSNRRLGDAIWGKDGIWTDANLHNVVAAVRRRLEAAGGEDVRNLLRNKPGWGYYLA